MGKVLSRLAAYAIRPVKNYNVQSRAEKYIEIPKVAPRHPTTTKIFEEQARSNPQVREEIQRKDKTLLNRLKDVYVTSENISPFDEVPELGAKILPPTKRPLPAYRPTFYNQEHVDEQSVRPTPLGKIRLMDLIKLLTENPPNPKKNANQIEDIVKRYALERDAARNVLLYYSTLRLLTPESSGSSVGADVNAKIPPIAMSTHLPLLKESSTPETKPERSEEKPK